MNANPNASVVLCYGDSNTNGTKPDRSGRFAADERWTGLLQKQLGDNYYVIEEGLGGRTTDLEHYNPDKPSRNGLVYFKACIDSHMPLDIIIVMLGTNDLKTTYNRSAEDVAQALKQYPEYVDKYCTDRSLKRPKIVLVSPAYMDENAPKFVESMPKAGVYDEISAQKSRQFSKPIERVAKETDCVFFDAATKTQTGEDGCHLDKQSHQNLADNFEKIVKDLEL
jgi:lysophospholipase L1-like esterase